MPVVDTLMETISRLTSLKMDEVIQDMSKLPLEFLIGMAARMRSSWAMHFTKGLVFEEVS